MHVEGLELAPVGGVPEGAVGEHAIDVEHGKFHARGALKDVGRDGVGQHDGLRASAGAEQPRDTGPRCVANPDCQ